MTQLLITGGAGFIGSHTCVVLLEAGHDLIVLDDFSNSSIHVLERVAELTHLPSGKSTPRRLRTVAGDVNDRGCLEMIFQEAIDAGKPVEAVVHFAGRKAVGESVQDPLSYWNVNVGGSIALMRVMESFACHTLVFSSSATLYGYPERVPIPETAPIQPINPYGQSKAAVERLLGDLVDSAPNLWRIACLRYFNPVGAHPSGRIGEDPMGIPNNLFPFVSQVAVGRRERVQVFGGDWSTPDGTCIRDYIHVMDLAEGHRSALECLFAEPAQLLTLNLGSGQGASVLEVVQAFQKTSGRKVPYEVGARRDGDAAITIADPASALHRLGWRTQRTLYDICRDGWAWQSANPSGYGDFG